MSLSPKNNKNVTKINKLIQKLTQRKTLQNNANYS